MRLNSRAIFATVLLIFFASTNIAFAGCLQLDSQTELKKTVDVFLETNPLVAKVNIASGCGLSFEITPGNSWVELRKTIPVANFSLAFLTKYYWQTDGARFGVSLDWKNQNTELPLSFALRAYYTPKTEMQNYESEFNVSWFTATNDVSNLEIRSQFKAMYLTTPTDSDYQYLGTVEGVFKPHKDESLYMGTKLEAIYRPEDTYYTQRLAFNLGWTF